MNSTSTVAHSHISNPSVNIPEKSSLAQKMVVPAMIISGIAFAIFSIAAHSFGLPFYAVILTGSISIALLAAAVLKLYSDKSAQNNSKNNNTSNHVHNTNAGSHTKNNNTNNHVHNRNGDNHNQDRNAGRKTLTSITSPQRVPKLTNYDQLPNNEEFNNIALISTSLGSQSVLTLPFSRNTLREARRQTGNIHPLRWLSTAMTDANLKVEMKKLYERRLRFDQRLVWNEFFDDYSKTFNRQIEKNNFACYLDKFAADLKLDSKLLHKIVEEKRWEDFFKVVFETLNTKH